MLSAAAAQSPCALRPDQAPDAMRSMASALQLVTNAIGSYVATAVTTIINDVTTANGSLGWLPNNLNQVHSLGPI